MKISMTPDLSKIQYVNIFMTPQLSKFSENFHEHARTYRNLVKISMTQDLSKFSENFHDPGHVEI